MCVVYVCVTVFFRREKEGQKDLHLNAMLK